MKKILILITIIFSITGISFAESNADFSTRIFNELDMNKDKVIDKNDLQKFSKKEFDASDIDKNGLVSKNEFFEFVCKKSCDSGECECKNYKNKEELSYMKDFWDKTDSNKDGNITFAEKLEDDLNTFYSLDSNGDGKIVKEDLDAQFF